jgi:hypothetical protein
MDNKREKFLEKREEVLNNLDVLMFNLEKCEDAGMIDLDSEIYNKIDELIEEVNSIDTLEELEELVSQGKGIESKIDMWLNTQGETTIGLSWPLFEESRYSDRD